MNSKGKTLVRQHYLVPRHCVDRLREIGEEQGTSVDDLVSRAIDAYSENNGVLSQTVEHAAHKALLAEIHRHVRAAVMRMDASLADVRRRERELRDPSLRAQVRQETALWARNHPSHAAEIFDFLCPPGPRADSGGGGDR